MIVRHLLRDLLATFPSWDKASKTSLLTAILLLIALLLVGFLGPQQVQMPARFGAFGLLLTLQMLLFWGGRCAISPYHQAQRCYIDGQYAAARDILELIPESQSSSVDALVLLGNCYRQLGQLDESSAAIQRALSLKPDYHYALYAAGKLRLASGDYHQARDYFESALNSGAPDLVHFELGQSCHYLGLRAESQKHLRKFAATDHDETAKAFLAAHYLKDKNANAQPLSREHVVYWMNEAERHQQTPYGKDLLDDIQRIQRAAMPNDEKQPLRPV